MKTFATAMSLTAALAIPARPVTAQPIEARLFAAAVLAPTDVVVQAFIEPDRRNRRVEFVVDSESMFASSTVELDGEHAPRTKEVRFRRLPAGMYEVRVTLIGTNGERGTAVHWLSLY